jgi:hypothetical protein
MRRLWLFLILTLSLLAVDCAAYEKHKALNKKLSEADKSLELSKLESKPTPLEKELSEIDLSKIGHIAPKGRVQDLEYNQIKIVEQLLQHNKDCIPYLIEKLDDETPIPDHVIDYWSSITIGDVALVVLTDFMTDPTGKTNAGTSWEELFGAKEDPNISAERYLRTQLARHGRRWLKKKWQKIWFEYDFFWDSQNRYFKLA